jgi:hypothetical protein
LLTQPTYTFQRPLRKKTYSTERVQNEFSTNHG